MKRTTLLLPMKKLGIDPKHFFYPRDANGFNPAAAQRLPTSSLPADSNYPRVNLLTAKTDTDSFDTTVT